MCLHTTIDLTQSPLQANPEHWFMGGSNNVSCLKPCKGFMSPRVPLVLLLRWLSDSAGALQEQMWGWVSKPDLRKHRGEELEELPGFVLGLVTAIWVSQLLSSWGIDSCLHSSGNTQESDVPKLKPTAAPRSATWMLMPLWMMEWWSKWWVYCQTITRLCGGSCRPLCLPLRYVAWWVLVLSTNIPVLYLGFWQPMIIEMSTSIEMHCPSGLEFFIPFRPRETYYGTFGSLPSKPFGMKDIL